MLRTAYTPAIGSECAAKPPSKTLVGNILWPFRDTVGDGEDETVELGELGDETSGDDSNRDDKKDLKII